jgi:hypothetical protein
MIMIAVVVVDIHRILIKVVYKNVNGIEETWETIMFRRIREKKIISSLDGVEKIESNKNFIDFNHLIPKMYILYMNHNMNLVFLIKGSIETRRLLINSELTSWIGLIQSINKSIVLNIENRKYYF